jgi:cytochrome c-type biogenesis protein CcmH
MSDASTPLSTLREQLRQLQQLHDAGALDTSAFEAAKAPLERKVLEAVMGAPALPPAPPAPLPAPKAGFGLWAGATVAVLVAAGVGYGLTGAPGAVGAAPSGFRAEAAAPDGPSKAAANAAPAVTREQIEAMVGKLESRLQTQPDDAEGWSMLGRTYMALNRYPEASTAYQKALKLRPDDATMLADYADVTAVNNGRKLDGEPTRLLERALKIDPDNLKALVLMGTAAYNRGDYVVAVKHWERVVQVGPPDNPMVDMARGGAAEARERGKLPPSSASASASAAAAGTAPVAAGPAASEVSGTVRLSSALKGLAAPEDTVFIFARPATGARMPLAIVRKQVKDLPFSFKLDDTLSMSPAARLSTAGLVVVGARISKSGQAAPQPGDLEGLSPAVAVGSQGVVVEIATKLP